MSGHGPSWGRRSWDAFNEQGGLAKVVIGVLTAVGTAAVLALGAWLVDGIRDSDGSEQDSTVVSSTSTSTAPDASVRPVPVSTAETIAGEATDPVAGAATATAPRSDVPVMSDNTPASDTTVIPDEPLEIAVLDDPPTFEEAVAGYWLDVPMLPPETWPGPSWEDWIGWLQQEDGADALTSFRLVVEGVAEGTVSITDARAVKERCVEPAFKGYFFVAPEGETGTIGWEFDLAEEVPRPYEVDFGVRGDRYFAERVITVARGEVVTIDVGTLAGPLDCEWVLELDIVLDGDPAVVRIDDHGTPFRTTGDAVGVRTHVMRAIEGTEIWVHPDPPVAGALGTPEEVWSWFDGEGWVLTESNSLGPDS